MRGSEHQPTKELRNVVKYLSIAGQTQESIAALLQIDPKTLRKHYREQLDESLDMSIAYAVGKLMENVKKGDRASIFFFLKTRGGWKETMSHEVSGPGGGPQRHEIAPGTPAKEAGRTYESARNRK